MLGLALASLVALLILSGYLLYYIGDDDVRSWVSFAHWLVGIVALPIFLLHYFQGKRIGRA